MEKQSFQTILETVLGEEGTTGESISRGRDTVVEASPHCASVLGVNMVGVCGSMLYRCLLITVLHAWTAEGDANRSLAICLPPRFFASHFFSTVASRLGSRHDRSMTRACNCKAACCTRKEGSRFCGGKKAHGCRARRRSQLNE